MTDEISPELFEKLVDLAALGVDPNEAAYLRLELNKQLQAIRILESVDIDVVHAEPEVTQLIETRLPCRADVWEPFENPEEILDQAPQVEDGYLIVPDITHTELD
ncbi:MAG: aspartyl/glutamyl-tRNA amidotransferase subunit C [Chloroflexi bacterium]|nr:aspartyl/glutamyl-tRNA amidotransferase subunit C [Chloroflexota bacterium]